MGKPFYSVKIIRSGCTKNVHKMFCFNYEFNIENKIKTLIKV